MDAQIHLSQLAEQKQSDAWNNHWETLWTFQGGLLVIGGFVGLAMASRGFPWILISLLPTMIALWLIVRAFRIKSYRRALEQIDAENELDYGRAERLKPILAEIAAATSTSFGVTESQQPGRWRPFRVERMLTLALRGELTGDFRARYWIGGDLSVRLRGNAVPDLLDSSTVLFLKNESQETLRVLVPSPRTIKEFLTREIESWSINWLRDTHTGAVLDKFAFSEHQLTTPISHPQVIDGLDAACELPFDARPLVNVIGDEVQPGVIMATALKVDGNRFIFFPSGLLKVLAEKLTPFIGPIATPGTMMTASPSN